MHDAVMERGSSRPRGLVIHWAGRYDLLVWLVTLGRERRFRERLLAPARLQPGESVLDVACGTGSLALAAKRRVGPSGSVTGVDASPAMIARARWKATRAGLDAQFGEAFAQALPFGPARFDVVLGTLMLHHLPRAERPVAVAEMRRVLRPGGRLLIVDFGSRDREHGLIARLHRHGYVPSRDIADTVQGAGLEVTESGPLGVWNLHFVLGTVPAGR